MWVVDREIYRPMYRVRVKSMTSIYYTFDTPLKKQHKKGGTYLNNETQWNNIVRNYLFIFFCLIIGVSN